MKRLIAIIGTVAIGFAVAGCGDFVESLGDKASKSHARQKSGGRASQRLAAGQLGANEFKAEIANGKEVLEWMKKSEELTELQAEEQLAQFKGNAIIIQGVVEETGKVSFSLDDEEIYVALKVGKVNSFVEIHIQFIVAGGEESKAKSLRKGQRIVMRGRITDEKGLETMFVKLVCRDSEIVPDAKYKEIMSQQ